MLPKNKYGLVGRDIAYSFSRAYFTEEFAQLPIDSDYVNFDIQDISEFPDVLKTRYLKGLNVTIPYKESVMAYLDGLSDTAQEIGAVNTIEFKDGKVIGHNTDWIGFTQSISPLLLDHHQKALILGKGGAAKAIAYALEQLQIDYSFVTRNAGDQLNFDTLKPEILASHTIVINTTPLGTNPDTAQFPQIPYHAFTANHLAFDLIYSPAETRFLQLAAARGAVIKNGYEMLVGQAEAAWKIWSE